MFARRPKNRRRNFHNFMNTTRIQPLLSSLPFQTKSGKHYQTIMALNQLPFYDDEFKIKRMESGDRKMSAWELRGAMKHQGPLHRRDIKQPAPEEVAEVPSMFRASIRNSKRKIKRVRFNRGVQMSLVPNAANYTRKQMSAIWFDGDERAQMVKDSTQNVNLLLNGEKLGPDHCARGLEYRTPEGCKRRADNKYYALCDILKEQDRQWNEGIYDEDALRFIYLKHSEPCLEAARGLGISDEAEAHAPTQVKTPKIQKDNTPRQSIDKQGKKNHKESQMFEPMSPVPAGRVRRSSTASAAA